MENAMATQKVMDNYLIFVEVPFPEDLLLLVSKHV
jgi:hypothetical protein